MTERWSLKFDVGPDRLRFYEIAETALRWQSETTDGLL